MENSSDSQGSDAPGFHQGRVRSLINRFFSRLGLRNGPDTTEQLEHEIQELLEEGEEQGLISRQEERLISSIFDFRETVASEIMTPSADVICAEEGTAVDELIHLVIDEGYTRIPIFHERPDNIIGVLHAKDLLRFCGSKEGGGSRLEQFFHSPMYIGEAKPITELLREFQAKKNHMAFVTDEFGSVRGLITLEDVIEEIVGDIDDEHDDEERELKVIDENTVVAHAKIDIEDIEAHFTLTLPEGPYESLGGFIVHRLGFLPGDGAEVQENGLVFKVLAADRRRVKTVRISRLHEPAGS
ncbi:MAG: hypothetical protein CSA34_02590 [Desulfobulbus propionicus]|nr:MAG: hypothetical protein CSA34_02590 [Desulfobulbus propionicus]